MTKVICIGSASKDIFFPTKEGEKVPGDPKKIIFQLGGKYHINDRFESLGGCAINQAVGLSRLDLEVSAYSSLGNDEIGHWLKKEVEKENIDTQLMSIEENSPSGLSAIVVDQNSGERIIFSNQEANERLEVNVEKLKGFDFVSATDLSGDWKGELSQVFDFCEKENIKFSFNPRRINIEQDVEKVKAFAGRAEIFFVNKDEAKEIIEKLGIENTSQEEEEIFLIKELKKFGCQVALLTDGERGAWGFNGQDLIQVKAFKENAIDSTGAGDAFSSGFMAAYLKGKSLEECLKWGIANGGSVVNFYGGVEGLMREKEIEEKIIQAESKKLN